MRNHSLIFAAFIALSASSADLATAEIYKWEDNQGVVHFTDDQDKIPARYRKKVRALDLRMEEKQAAPVPATREPSSTSTEASDPGVAPTRDRTWWQSRFRTLRGEKKLLEDRLPGKREELIQLNRKRAKFSKPVDRIAYKNLDEEIGKDEVRIKNIDKELADLEMEAAKEAVPVEWRK